MGLFVEDVYNFQYGSDEEQSDTSPGSVEICH